MTPRPGAMRAARRPPDVIAACLPAYDLEQDTGTTGAGGEGPRRAAQGPCPVSLPR